jgi:glycosyltransferase involved in cell wall biosynthesis
VTDGLDVSVVIPTHNRADLVTLTLAGVLRQEDVELEAIVVNDGSTDDTADRLAQLDDPRVVVIDRKQAGGVASARNAGIQKARGRWLAFLDDDDFWSPRKLRAQIDAADTAGAVLAYSGAVVLDADWRAVEALPAPPAEGILDLLLPGNAIPAGASNVIARADAVKRVGGFDEALSQLADWDMWLRLTAEGSAAACPEPLVGYVQHSGSMLLNDRSRALVEEFKRVAAKHGHLAADPRRDFDRAGLFRWIGWGHARAGRRLRAAVAYVRAAALRPPYGSRESLKDAFRALAGRETAQGATVPERATETPAWVALYRADASRPPPGAAD